MRTALWGVCVALSATACLPDDQRTDSLDPSTAGQELSAEAMAQVDSGNVAYREGEYQAALAHYMRVTEMAPDNATGWFGLYMAHEALGNTAAADSAIAEARKRNPGASLIRDTLEDGS
ncbi:MAG: tetratricopeptide repeat protein [Gemmatimonadota bacterium]